MFPAQPSQSLIDGVYQLTEHDVQSNVKHLDEISYGDWFVDLHTPGGLLAEHSEPAAGEGYTPDSDYAAKSYVGPYGIPLRAHIAADVDTCSWLDAASRPRMRLWARCASWARPPSSARRSARQPPWHWKKISRSRV